MEEYTEDTRYPYGHYPLNPFSYQGGGEGLSQRSRMNISMENEFNAGEDVFSISFFET